MDVKKVLRNFGGGLSPLVAGSVVYEFITKMDAHPPSTHRSWNGLEDTVNFIGHNLAWALDGRGSYLAAGIAAGLSYYYYRKYADREKI